MLSPTPLGIVAPSVTTLFTQSIVYAVFVMLCPLVISITSMPTGCSIALVKSSVVPAPLNTTFIVAMLKPCPSAFQSLPGRVNTFKSSVSNSLPGTSSSGACEL